MEFKVVRPEYIYFQIIPDTSIRNYNSENIAKAIVSMFRTPKQRLKIESQKILKCIPVLKAIKYYAPEKVAFFIDIYKEEVNFYVICSKFYENLIYEKCSATWPKATINKVSKIPNFSDKLLKLELHYAKEDALSLKIDRRNNEPLNNILNVINIADTNDRIGVLYNFIPCNQFAWRSIHQRTIDKVKKKEPVDKEKKSAKHIGKILFKAIFDNTQIFLNVVNDFIFTNPEHKVIDESALALFENEIYKRLSPNTRSKENSQVLETQIVVLSDSPDTARQENNAVAAAESFKTLTEDNALVYKKMKNKIKFTLEDYKLPVMSNLFSTLECKNFLEIPGRDLLQMHPGINKIDILENPIPEELQNGYMYLGITTFKGKPYKSYLRNEYNIGNLPLVIMGPQNSGKTTLVSNLAHNASDNKESVVFIDFIKNCEASQAVERVVPKSKCIIIDCSDINSLQGFGFNEAKFMSGQNDFQKLEVANLQAKQTTAFINAINIGDDRTLTPAMRRYLSAAANIVYLTGKTNIGDVIKCLRDHRVRMDYISKVQGMSDTINSYLENEILDLIDLNEIGSKGDEKGQIIGTKDSKIQGILDRVSTLEEDIYAKIMFNKNCDNNIDFVKSLEEGKIILIRMPENKFNTTMVKDVLTTFFAAKVILSIKIRGCMHEKPLRSNIIIDEIYQCPICTNMIKETIAQTRKIGGHYIFTCHYLSQIGLIKDELKGSGASYMLLKGTDKKNYEELKEELSPFTLEDMQNLPEHGSLNLIAYEKGFARFITKLPPPIK